MYDYNCPDCNEAKLQSDKNARKINEVIDQVNALIQVNNETVDFLEDKANEIVGEIAEVKVNENIGDLKTSLDNNANYNVGSVNILNYSIFKIDDCWDEALDEAFKSNKRIYFPNGEYRFKKGCKNLENGNLIYGDGVNHTKLIFNCNDSYLMKFNKNGGFKDICITTENNYNGDVLLLDSPSINENNGRYYTLENVNIYLGFKSGLGTGLKIQIRNNDGINVYPADNKNSLVYFYVKNFEVYSGNKCIEIYGNQMGEVHNQIWMTASTFSHIRMNSCMYGLYINIENTSNKNVLDFNSLKFNDIEIQTAPKGWFTSDVTKGTTPIYVKGLPNPEWRVHINFNELTIWDSEDGVSGILENANVKITNFFATYTLKDSNHKQGFKCINSHVNIDEDITRVRTTGASGGLSEINYVDGGFQFINCPDTNGWSAKGKLYQELTNGSNSQVVLESYNKNNSKTSYLNLGDQIEMYDNTFTSVNIKATDHAGTLRDVLTRGYKNTLYNSSTSEQGFFSGNGMWIGEQRTTLDIPPSENYQEIQVPITETFTYTPFLLGYTIHYAEPYNDTNEDVFVRIAQVIDKTKIRFRVKHSKSTNINVRVSFVLCGYKEI